MEVGRPGRKRRLVLEDEYWKLVATGVGTALLRRPDMAANDQPKPRMVEPPKGPVREQQK